MNPSTMTATQHAALSASPAQAATRQLRPLVFIDGRCAPELTVSQYDVAGTLDTRRAVVRGPKPAGDPRLTVALPTTLADGAVPWRVLVDGHMATADRVLKPGLDVGGFEVLDDWARALERTLSAEEQGDLLARTTCGQVLDWLADAATAQAETPVITRGSDAERSTAITLSRAQAASIGAVWQAITDRLNRRVQTALSRIAGQVRRVTRLLPIGRGRPIALPWAHGGVGRVTAMRSQ